MKVTSFYGMEVDEESAIEMLRAGNLFGLMVKFETADEMNAFVARFPKSLKVKALLHCVYRETGMTMEPTISMRVSSPKTQWNESKVTGSVNETGEMRIRRFFKEVN